MATRLGRRSPRLAAVRALRTSKGRSEQRRFAFEGATLLAEAVAAGLTIAELYATEAAYAASPLVRELDSSAIPCYLIEEPTVAGISDLTAPSGILAVSSLQLRPVSDVFSVGSPILVLADLNDPANAGTLLRSADAFGCVGVLFGELGIDPYHPKVVRGSMGAIFRLAVAVAGVAESAAAAHKAGVRLLGLAADGLALRDARWESPFALVVGNERRGLAHWHEICEQVLAVPMRAPAESLSAGVAGSIALYEATQATFSGPCQESI